MCVGYEKLGCKRREICDKTQVKRLQEEKEQTTEDGGGNPVSEGPPG